MRKVADFAAGLAVIVGTAFACSVAAAQSPELIAPKHGLVRALVVGIDAYRNVRQLKGAVADARDIEGALRRAGTTDITLLLDDQVDRATVLRRINDLIARTEKSDLVLLTIAGHGTQEPERVRGSEPDGMQNVFLLTGFGLNGASTGERILGSEFNHFIKQLEGRGAQVLFVADTCHGGGMVRSIDPRAEEMSFRQVPRYVLTEDVLRPVSSSQDELLSPLDFKQTSFLAAVDRNTKAPEVHISGIPGLRGALSYAIARAFEGNADANKDGRVTIEELFTNIRQVVYQLSDQRQNIVAMSSPPQHIDRDAAFELTRGIKLVDSAPKQQLDSTPKQQLDSTPGQQLGSAPKQQTTVVTPARVPATSTSEEGRVAPIRIASLDGDLVKLAGLNMRETPFEVVGLLDSPDVVWDPSSWDVLANGDVVAYRMEKNELPSVIDQIAAIARVKRLTVKSPQPMRVTPDDRLHPSGTEIEVQIDDVAGRSLILFNIAGDGTVQALYPVGSDEPVIRDRVFKLTVRVREPFGADRVVAVTGKRPMTELQSALNQINQTRKPSEMVRMIERYAPAEARVGSVGLFTGR